MESHEPVQRLSASLLTPRQLTRLSCPCNVPTRSPRRTSQTWRLVSTISYPYEVVSTDLALEIIIAGEQQTPRHRERYRCDAADGLRNLTKKMLVTYNTTYSQWS